MRAAWYASRERRRASANAIKRNDGPVAAQTHREIRGQKYVLGPVLSTSLLKSTSCSQTMRWLIPASGAMGVWRGRRETSSLGWNRAGLVLVVSVASCPQLHAVADARSNAGNARNARNGVLEKMTATLVFSCVAKPGACLSSCRGSWELGGVSAFCLSR